MKKISFSLSLLISFLSASILTSCGEDFLDCVPENNYTADHYYTSDATVMKAVDPMYNYAWFNFNSRAIVNIGSQRANDGWNPWNNPEFSTFQVTGLHEQICNSWSSFYMVISMSNQLMHDLNEYCSSSVSKEVKDQAFGEAYFMRGVAYFYLVRSWGDVIVYEDNLAMTQNPNIPLTKEEDVLKFCIRDFRKAAELLPATSKNNHVTKYSAKAYLAKALLALSGWNKGTRDEDMLKEVSDLCDEITGSKVYDLVPDYEDLFKYENNNFGTSNCEDLFSLKWVDPVIATWGNGDVKFPDLAWQGSTDITSWGGIYASVDMLDLFNEEPADISRRRATFFYPGDYYDYFDTGNDLVAAEKKTKENGYPQSSGYLYTKKIPYLKKYVVGTKADCGGHLGGENNCSPLNTYMMRLADVYLMKAEAKLGNKASTDDKEGVEALYKVRNRAGLDKKESYTLEDIIKERRKEFCMEYTNWYDMVTWYRWKPNYMLDYFNNKQHRAYMMADGDVKTNPNGTIAYCTYPQRQASAWYTSDWSTGEELRWWSDGWHNTAGDLVDIDIPHKSLDEMSRKCIGYDPVILSEENIFLPYPEADVLRNPYFNAPAQNYNFTW